MQELVKCENSEEYFYENYCRKENMPEYSKEEFEKYINTVKVMRSGFRLGDRRMKAHLKQYPLTPKDIFPIYRSGIDPYKDGNESKGSLGS